MLVLPGGSRGGGSGVLCGVEDQEYWVGWVVGRCWGGLVMHSVGAKRLVQVCVQVNRLSVGWGVLFLGRYTSGIPTVSSGQHPALMTSLCLANVLLHGVIGS